MSVIWLALMDDEARTVYDILVADEAEGHPQSQADCTVCKVILRLWKEMKNARTSSGK